MSEEETKGMVVTFSEDVPKSEARDLFRFLENMGIVSNVSFEKVESSDVFNRNRISNELESEVRQRIGDCLEEVFQ